MKKALTIRYFSDPTCPFAYSAEPARWQLKWLYGEQLAWEMPMIVLSSAAQDNESRNFTAEKQAKVLQRVSRQHRMPINTEQRERVAVSLPASNAFVAVRLNAPEKAAAFLRKVRIAAMRGALVDEPAVLHSLLAEADISIDDYETWLAQNEVAAALQADMAAARQPTKTAMALSHKLSVAGDGSYRYSSPSYQFIVDDSIAFEVPGFWPAPFYDVAIANLAPELERRPAPNTVKEVLEWATVPLATAEVAAIVGRDFETTRASLAKVATLDPLGDDGFWTLK